MATKNEEARVIDPHQKVTVKIPKKKGDPDAVYVNVNTHTFMIPRGKPCEVPLYIARILEQSELQNDSVLEMIETRAIKPEPDVVTVGIVH